MLETVEKVHSFLEPVNAVRGISIAVVAVLAFPGNASAMTLLQALGVFHMFLGAYLVVTLLVFSIGVYSYFARLGTWPTYRDISIEVMEWGLVMLFVLVVLLGIVQFFQKYPGGALPILAFVLIVIAAFFILRFAAVPKKKEKKDA